MKKLSLVALLITSVPVKTDRKDNVTDGGQAVVAGDEVASRARGRRRTAVGDDRK
jgi:hypothetical protein